MFDRIPPVVKNLIIINVIMFVATFIVGNFMYEKLSLFCFQSPFFKPYQLLTHMFMHGGFFHIFFNMYTLFIFGSVLENVWGGQKFLFYYLVTGLGAALLHNLTIYIEISSLANAAEAGNMLAGAMLFPNNVMQLIFPPIALKAKWFVLIFGVIELLSGLSGAGSNIAHFAHLGGMIFGYFIILYWKKNNRMYY